MLFTFAVILLILWLLGVVGTYTIGAFVHVRLVVAIVLFGVGLRGRRRAGGRKDRDGAPRGAAQGKRGVRATPGAKQSRKGTRAPKRTQLGNRNPQ